MLAVLGNMEVLVLVALLVGFGLGLRRMGRWSLVFIASLFVVCAVTNPSEDEHRAAVFSRMQDGLDPPGRAAAATILSKETLPLRYENFIVASRCTIHDRPVSFGILKNVIVPATRSGRP